VDVTESPAQKQRIISKDYPLLSDVIVSVSLVRRNWRSLQLFKVLRIRIKVSLEWPLGRV